MWQRDLIFDIGNIANLFGMQAFDLHIVCVYLFNLTEFCKDLSVMI